MAGREQGGGASGGDAWWSESGYIDLDKAANAKGGRLGTAYA